MTTQQATQKTYGWSCSPNIAIIKYWGKYPGQIPASPSISFTLNKSKTETTLRWIETDNKIHFTFNGNEAPAFAQRIEQYFDTLKPLLPWLNKTGAVIDSKNNFPHSAGIASSASAFAALAMCLAETHLHLSHISDHELFPFASHLARIGSGSASRSVFGGFTHWGRTPGIEKSNDLMAIPLDEIHPVFSDLRDLIVVVSDQKKSVSSSAGHSLMTHHPYASNRYQLARERTASMLAILKSGDIELFSQITIAEGLGLHALMLSSTPPVNLLEPLTVEIIRQADRFRKDTGLPLAYTLDAGPNVHLIYPAEMEQSVRLFTEQRLAPILSQVRLIDDCIGTGPQRLSVNNND